MFDFGTQMPENDRLERPKQRFGQRLPSPLALLHKIPLATIDKKLSDAAALAGVAIFQPPKSTP